MSDIRDTQNKPLITLTGADNYLRWKSYAMSELRQRGCDWAVTGRELPTVDSIKAKLIDRGFQNNQLKPNILINMLVQEEEKHHLAVSKAGGILSKLISDALQPIIEDKTPQDAWNALQERFQHVDVMSTSRIIYEATSRKLSEFKNVTEYTSSYQAAFDKVGSLLADSSPYTRNSTEAYFQATMLMNIGSEYSALVSSIQKEWKTAEATDLPETILQIIRHFEFMKGTTKDNILRVTTPTGTQQTVSLAGGAPKGSCTNPECIEKGLTTHYTDKCWVKNPELRKKYALGKMRTRGLQRDLRAPPPQELPGNEIPELDS